MDGNVSVVDPGAYPQCAMGMLLPLVDESEMSMSLRIIMYLVGKCRKIHLKSWKSTKKYFNN